MKDTTKFLIGGVIVVIIGVIIFTIFNYGGAGFLVLLKKLGFYLLIVAFFAAIVFGIFWIYQVKQIDLIAVHRDNIIEACKRNQTPYKQTLTFSSQGDNWAQRELGRVVGYCMIKSAPKRVLDKEGEFKLIDETYKDMLFLAWRPPGLFNWLFNTCEVVAGTKDDFSRLSGDVVYLRGMTFAPKIFGVFFLSHHWEEREFIDETIKENIFRYTLQEALKNFATIVEDAIDASPAHKKKQEVSNVQTVPLGAYLPQPPAQK